MVRCKRCGKIEACGFEEIMLNASIYVHIQWCPLCGELNGVSIEE